MIPDESVPTDFEAEAPHPLLKSANDDNTAVAPIDPRVLVIARAIGGQIAREELDRLRVANDNRPEDEC